MCVSVGEKKGSDPPALELQMIVDLSVSAGNQIWVLCKSNKCS